MNTIIAITAGLVINGLVAFGIARVSKNLWMVAGLVTVYKLVEVAIGNYFDIAQVKTLSAWVVTAIIGFLLFMVTVQIFTFLCEKEAEKEEHEMEKSKA